jgi:hypothetical protein
MPNTRTRQTHAHTPNTRTQLYVVNGAAQAPSLHDPVEALLADDDENPLFRCVWRVCLAVIWLVHEEGAVTES